MSGTAINYNALSKVAPRALMAYAASNGWVEVEPYGDVGYIYAFPDTDAEIVIPASTRFADYEIRMLETVEALSKTEDRGADAVLRDLLLVDVDLVRVRLTDAEDDGSISVSAGAAMIGASRGMLIAAACSTVRPQRFFRSGRNKAAQDYIDEVRLGQTDQGSFIINLLSPVPPALQHPLFPDMADDPFPRRVTRKLASGLRAAREAVDLADSGQDIGAFEEVVPAGVSANLCDAVGAMLSESGASGLDISVNWALNRPRDSGRVHVGFSQQDAPTLKEASRVLKYRLELPDERVEGYVNRLARQESDYQGRVTIRGFVDGSIRSIRVDFNPEDYHLIVGAHDERRTISVEGDLRRDGQRWTLANPRDLVVYADDDDE